MEEVVAAVRGVVAFVRGRAQSCATRGQREGGAAAWLQGLGVQKVDKGRNHEGLTSGCARTAVEQAPRAARWKGGRQPGNHGPWRAASQQPSDKAGGIYEGGAARGARAQQVHSALIMHGRGRKCRRQRSTHCSLMRGVALVAGAHPHRLHLMVAAVQLAENGTSTVVLVAGESATRIVRGSPELQL